MAVSTQVAPCVRGTMGSTTYYQTVMNARSLVSVVRPAKEMDGWTNMSIEERMQRDINMKRLFEGLIPYLTNASDRLFGSLIVLIYDGKVEFEALSQLGIKVAAAYRSCAENMGFLTIEGGQLIALDGQHRLVALREIIQGTDNVPDGTYNAKVPDDEISVMFIKYESDEKTRRIFNKVNRYAKPTSRGDNIITSEDDGYAIVTRRLLEEGEPLCYKVPMKEKGKEVKKDIVNWKSNTIAPNSSQLTTISALYDINKSLLAHHGVKDFDEKQRVNRPTDVELQKAYEYVQDWWWAVLSGIAAYKAALADLSSISKAREESEPFSVLFKPLGQVALFKGLIKAKERGVERKDAIARANLINWNIKADLWRDVLFNAEGKIFAEKDKIELTSELIAYLLSGAEMESEDIAQLRIKYNEARGFNYDDLKDEDAEPELPMPITDVVVSTT